MTLLSVVVPCYNEAGNLRELHRLPGTHKPMGDQTSLTELFEFDSSKGTGEGMGVRTNFLTQHTDARGGITRHSYDKNSNRVRTQHRIASIVEDFEYDSFGQITAHVHPNNASGVRRRDEFTYNRYLDAVIVDALNQKLRTAFEYDKVGNATRVIDPRGNDTLFTYNALNQVVRRSSR